MTDIEIMNDLIKRLTEASYAYYALDKPIMSDKSYDKLYDQLEQLEKETGIILAGSPTQKVQGYVIKGFNKVTHSKPMLSAQKTKDIKEIRKYFVNYPWYCSGKLDGNSLVLRYFDGKFLQGITRGNGLIGEDVTEACRFIKNLPMAIPYRDDLEIRGECVMSWEEFNRINEGLKDKYSHPRNLASGTLRQLDLNVVKERELSFVAFECVSRICKTKSEDLDLLDSFGFETVLRHEAYADVETVADRTTEEIKADKYPYDGLVFSIDDYEVCDRLGSTNHHTNDLFALKWMDSTYETTLLDVEWNPTKTGLLFPTAIIEPVDLDGAITSRVTLNNLTYIKNLELGIGDTITVYRSNMVIPCIDENLTRSNNLSIPERCPVCGSRTKILKENDSEILVCTNPQCKGRWLGKLTHFVSKKGMDIAGLSEQILTNLTKLCKIKTFADIYRIKDYEKFLKTVPGFGKKSVDKLLASIEASRHNVDLAHFICALSIPNVGSVQARELAKAFKTWEEFYMACTGDYDFRRLEGFGKVLNCNLHNYFSVSNDIGDLLDYIDFANSSDSGAVGDNGSHSVSSLEGMVFVITGKLNNFSNRGQLTEEIISHGGSVSSSISKMTSFLINNDLNSTSSKNKKAKELGIPIISEEDFLRMVG